MREGETCSSKTWVMGQEIPCEEHRDHYRQSRSRQRTRHRWYSGDSLDTEITWEDPLTT